MRDAVVEILEDIRPESEGRFAACEDFLAERLIASMDIVMLVSDLDDRFDINIDPGDIVPENFRNLAAIEALLSKHGVGS